MPQSLIFWKFIDDTPALYYENNIPEQFPFLIPTLTNAVRHRLDKIGKGHFDVAITCHDAPHGETEIRLTLSHDEREGTNSYFVRYEMIKCLEGKTLTIRERPIALCEAADERRGGKYLSYTRFNLFAQDDVTSVVYHMVKGAIADLKPVREPTTDRVVHLKSSLHH